MCNALVETVSNLEVLDFLSEGPGELVVDALLHVDSVGAYASLATTPKLARNRAVHSRFEVCIVEHNKPETC